MIAGAVSRGSASGSNGRHPDKEVGPGVGGGGVDLPATPCVNGFAGTFPCANVDLLAFLPTSSVGSTTDSTNDVWGWTDPQTGREYALLGRSSGTSFVDITNPEVPVYLGNLPTHTLNSLWRDLEVYNNHAFIVSEASGHGMQVFDLTQLRNVTAPPVTFSETAHYSGFSTAHTLAINTGTGFAYANGSNTCSGGLHMVDIRIPTSPVMAGCFSSDGYTHDTQCVLYNGPDAAFAGREICFCSNEDTLTIVDVTNKAAPSQISRTTYSGSGYSHQGWLTENHTFFLMDDELDETRLNTLTRTHIWNVSNLAAPQRSAIYEGATRAIDHNLYIRGNFVYQANYRSGLRILDASAVASGVLREVAFFDVIPADDNPSFSGSWSAFPFFPSGTILVNGIGEGLYILRHNLSGNGMGLPNFLMMASTASATIRPGQSATFPLVFSAQNTFNSPITLTCAGLPAGGTCAFAPNPVNTGPISVVSNLTITTVSSSPPPAPAPSAPPAAAGLLVPAVLTGLLAKWRRPQFGAAFALGLVLLAGMAGCGSNETVAPPPPPTTTGGGTPPGTYSITVTGASASLQHSTTVNLVVQ